MLRLRKSYRSSKGSTKSSGPNTALEATGHSVRFVAGAGVYGVARASAGALDAKGTKTKTAGQSHTQGVDSSSQGETPCKAQEEMYESDAHS
jgi:hypothetical protein